MKEFPSYITDKSNRRDFALMLKIAEQHSEIFFVLSVAEGLRASGINTPH